MTQGHPGAGGRHHLRGHRLRRGRRGRRRGGLQHLHDRLPGDPDRPVLRRADGLHDLPGAGELRGGGRGRRVGPGPRRPASSCATTPSVPSNFRRGAEPRRLPRGATAWSGSAGIDTRRLVRHLRTTGAQMGIISTGAGAAELVARAPAPAGHGGAGPRHPHLHAEPVRVAPGRRRRLDRRGARRDGPAPRFHVVAYDWGLKRAMLRLPGRAGLPHHRGARPHHRRRGAGAQAGRRLPHQRPGRPGRGGGGPGRRSRRCSARCRSSASAWATRSSSLALGGQDLQAQVRPPRRQPAGQGPGHRQGGHHRAEPRLRGGRAARSGRGPGSPT